MDKLQQIKLPIDKEFEEFRRLFDSSLQSSNSLLSEVLSYIKQRNGKMMRPILALLIAKLFGEINDSSSCGPFIGVAPYGQPGAR